MAETFSLFGLQGYSYGLCAAVGAALLLIGMRLVGRDLPNGTVSVFGVLGMLFGIVFARALYCAVNWNDFMYNYENPMLALRFFDGGMSLPGAIAGMVLAAAVTARLAKVRFAQLMDALAVPFGRCAPVSSIQSWAWVLLWKKASSPHTCRGCLWKAAWV